MNTTHNDEKHRTRSGQLNEQRSARRVGFILLLLVVAGVSSLTLGIHSVAWVQEAVNPTQRIQLNTTTIGVLRVGKSCEWIRGKWHCRDCDARGKCHTLQRKRVCRPFGRQKWDNPPRFSSHFDPTSNDKDLDLRMLTKFGVGKVSKVHFEQPMCTVSTCFDLARCKNDTVLTIYANTTGPHELLDYAIRHGNGQFVRVNNYQDACLVVVTKGVYTSADELHSALHWNGSGRNNLLWDSSCFFDGILCDSPFSTFSYGHAALASGTLTRAHLRSGYDLTLPLARVWGRPVSPEQVDIHRPRKWLLSFRGSIQDSLHPYYQHRWLAAEYWNEEEDVIVDVQCKHRKLLGGKKVTYKHYQLNASSYDDMIRNSTFGFSPGGSSVSSYRFGEILSTGGIPVVTQDFVPPLYPEVDWSKCLVIVSEARIVDLPRILRAYSPEQVKERQRACWYLLQNVIGDKQEGSVWRGDERVVFTKAMKVWVLRISSALKQKEAISKLNQDIMVTR